MRERFAEKGVLYQRVHGVGLDWRTVFGSSDPSAVEARARAEGFECAWLPGDRLRTRCVRPAVVAYPGTGELSWFNQAQHWHPSCLDDGSPIADDDMRGILEVYREVEGAFPWQKGDVLVLDNILAAHARDVYAGPRKILVALGQMHPRRECRRRKRLVAAFLDGPK